MRREVLVADAKPRRLAKAGQRFENVERIALHSVAGVLVEHAGQPVDHRIHIG
jgi:hypothetical protein